MIKQAEKHGKRRKDCPMKMPKQFENMDYALGCTSGAAYDHLANSGKHGETWDDYGMQKAGGPRKCNVDHIMPLASLGDSTIKKDWL